MATVNELVVLMPCTCGRIDQRIVQFRYGRLRLISYQIGSDVEWGEPALGDSSDELALVQGWLTSCQECSADGDVGVVIRRGRIVGITDWRDIDSWANERTQVYRYED